MTQALEGASILLDGHHFQMPEGTGIRTYCFTLARALKSKGAHVSVLIEPPRYPSRVQDLIELVRAGASLGRVKASRADRTEAGPAADLDFVDSFIMAERPPPGRGLLFRLAGVGTTVKTPSPPDFFHATYPIPYGVKGARTITTIHDLIPLVLPWTTLEKKETFRRKIQYALDRSDAIVTVSKSSKKDLLEIMGADPARVHVAYTSVEPPAGKSDPRAARETLSKLGVEPKGYVLFVGAIEPKKNLGGIISALIKLGSPLPLVVVGAMGWLYEEELKRAGELRNGKGPIMAGYVAGPELDALYENAAFLAFPSLYEGFGLPAVEAMARGCPVLTSNVSSLPEICDDAALFADPYNVDDMAEKMKALIDSEKLREDLAEKGKKRAAFFSLNNFADSIEKAYLKTRP